MTLFIKEPGKLEKDIVENSSGSFPVLVLDTGGLIDIVHSTRGYGLNGKGIKEKNPNYEKATSLLNYLSEKLPVLITPKTYQEMQDHGRMQLNQHTVELSPRVVNFALQTMINSQKFMSQLETGFSQDDIRYDAYWASREGCNGNPKKYLEGCSDVDKEILTAAAILSKSKINMGSSYKEVGKVIVLSPDAHIIQGAEFLKRGFDGKYSNIVPISTRR